jgi:hypothetical protein
MPLPSSEPQISASALVDALATGRTYFWALRQAREGAPDALRRHGIDAQVLAALRELEPTIVRPPHPAHARADHRYLRLTLPGDVELFFSPLVCEATAESGTELFPHRTAWTFAHHEIQYCTGGDTPMHAVLPHGAREDKRFALGDVMVIPEGTHVTYLATEEHGFGHAHIFTMVLSDRPRTFYDAVPALRLRARGLLAADEPPELYELHDRVETLDWGDLAEVRPGGARQLPTWLRNGAANRELTRALDYHEGTRSLVISSPDRRPEQFLDWGHGRAQCRVNPLVSEAAGAVTDCVLPAGWFASFVWTELWTVLRGRATVVQTLAPLHDERSVTEVSAGSTLVAPAGARVEVPEASDDLVVRRLAGSAAHNAHWAMMERKLEQDGEV